MRQDAEWTPAQGRGDEESPSFARSARRLAGIAGVAFGWAPEVFWRATPAELAALVAAVTGDADTVPPDAATLTRLKEAFPDG